MKLGNLSWVDYPKGPYVYPKEVRVGRGIHCGPGWTKEKDPDYMSFVDIEYDSENDRGNACNLGLNSGATTNQDVVHKDNKEQQNAPKKVAKPNKKLATKPAVEKGRADPTKEEAEEFVVVDKEDEGQEDEFVVVKHDEAR